MVMHRHDILGRRAEFLRHSARGSYEAHREQQDVAAYSFVSMYSSLISPTDPKFTVHTVSTLSL